LVVSILLLAWTARVVEPESVPPGWRDDELINIHVLTDEVLSGQPVLYFTGASGHEPLYHTLHAGIIALIGYNPFGGHFLSIASGVLSVALTFMLVRQLHGPPTALLAAALMSTSFWSLMYSRVAIRHALVLPPMLAAIYLLGSAERPEKPSRATRVWAGGLCLAAALYTYTVARMLVLLVATFGLYLFIFHRDQFHKWWRPAVAALLLAALLTGPLWIAIVRGRSEAAALGIGSDARITELAVPLRELWSGNPKPLLENVWATLGMFHANGDPEWLYNLPGRPVFGAVGAVLFLIGLGICLYRWRDPRYAFLVLWLVVGISPALVTYPHSSLGHTILAQPVAYMIVALSLVEGSRSLSSYLLRFLTADRVAVACIAVAILAGCAISVRDLRDYFVQWPNTEEVHFLYREAYRDAAEYLDAHADVQDVVVTSLLMGPWDRLAIADDLRREDVQVRLFDPARAFLFPSSGDPLALIVDLLPRDPMVDEFISRSSVQVGEHLYAHEMEFSLLPTDLETAATFANGLQLLDFADWPAGAPSPGTESSVWLLWRVGSSLDLPPMPVVANPPPPGVYAGPRMVVFAHLFAGDGAFVVGDDGLWVDPTTLRPGDSFLQVHRFTIPGDAPPGPYRLEVGLYDPMDGYRWAVLGDDGEWIADRFAVPIAEW
jgi:hypothetical protein